MTKTEQIRNLIRQRLVSAFPAVEIKDGWPETYVQNDTVYPLITLAPGTSTQSYSGSGVAGKHDFAWVVYIVDHTNQPDTDVTARLIRHLHAARKALIAPVAGERHNTYGGLLIGEGPKEQGAVRFVEPMPGMPLAGLALTILTPHTESLE